MQEKVYKTKIANVDKLCDRIFNAWEELYQHVIGAAVRQWRARLHACVCLLGVDTWNIFCDWNKPCDLLWMTSSVFVIKL